MPSLYTQHLAQWEPSQDYVFSTKQQYLQAITTHQLACIQWVTWNRFQSSNCQVIIFKTLSKPWQKCFCCIPRKYLIFLENKIFECIWKNPAFLWFYICPDYAYFTQINYLITHFFLKLKADLISKFPFSYWNWNEQPASTLINSRDALWCVFSYYCDCKSC